jgi:hypothetical protein
MAIMTSSTRRTGDHFEPNDVDPQVQRRLRGYLEQIDYTAFASNKAVLGATMGMPTASASSAWPWPPRPPAPSGWPRRPPWPTLGRRCPKPRSLRLAHLRTAYEELSAVYEATRRMVERGYVAYRPIQG